MSSDSQPEPVDDRAHAGEGERPRTLAESVGAAAFRLQSAYLGRHGDREQARARATLAELRRAVGTPPDRNPIAWQRVLDEVIPTFPPHLIGRGNAHSRSESAAYDALTFFALHMQSQTQPMHVRGVSFGQAVAVLIRRRTSESIKPRFDATLSVRSESTRRYHLRNLITLIRTEHIGLDYGRFATDLAALSDPDTRRRNAVLLRWGRDAAQRHVAVSTTSTAS